MVAAADSLEIFLSCACNLNPYWITNVLAQETKQSCNDTDICNVSSVVMRNKMMTGSLMYNMCAIKV